MNLTIRSMEPGDCEAVFSLFSKCFHDPWSLSSVEDMFRYPGYVNMVAFLGEELIAYVGCLAVMDEADITNVAVSPEHRHLGIATTLLQKFIPEIQKKGITHVFLEVRESNLPAITLYDHAGFKKTGIRKGYYSHPKENAILMMWEDEVR